LQEAAWFDNARLPFRTAATSGNATLIRHRV